MEPLDDNNYIDQSSVSMMPTAIRYGLIGALVLIIISLILNMAGMGAGSGSSTMSSLVSILVFAGVVYVALKKHRDEDLGGFMTYGRAIGLGTLTCLIMGLIGSVFTFIYISYIDPTVMDMALEQARAQYETMGMDDEQIDQAMSYAEKFTSPPIVAIMSVVSYVFIGFLASLIVGAILKKNRPEVY